MFSIRLFLCVSLVLVLVHRSLSMVVRNESFFECNETITGEAKISCQTDEAWFWDLVLFCCVVLGAFAGVSSVGAPGSRAPSVQFQQSPSVQ